MSIFSIDSSHDLFFTISILSDEYKVFAKKIHGQITDNLFKVLESISTQIEKIDYFAVNIGPGSYTGIRGAISAMQGITIGMGKKLLSANTFQILAYKFFQQNKNFDGEIDIYLKSYNEEFLYHQKLSKNFQELTKPCKIASYSVKKSQDKTIISNILDFGHKIETSAQDLALLINHKIKSGYSFGTPDPLYITT